MGAAPAGCPMAVHGRSYLGLCDATAAGDTDEVLALLNGGANADEAGFFGNRPLHIAAIRGDVQMALLLLMHAGAIGEPFIPPC